MLGVVIHTLHVMLAGVWLGGVVFTTFVVSPAFKAMKWSEVERVGARSMVGRYFARVGGWNLGLLLLFAIVDGALGGFGAVFFVEYVLLAMLLGLAGAHGAYFGRKIAELAAAEAGAESAEKAKSFAERRRALGRASLRVSQLDLLVSVAIVALAVNA
jgi:uncharacterized membrane protein